LADLFELVEHCREGETNCWISIFWGVSSDRIRKSTKDVSVHFFIQRFTSRDDLFLDKAFAV